LPKTRVVPTFRTQRKLKLMAEQAIMPAARAGIREAKINMMRAPSAGSAGMSHRAGNPLL
jgi:hypothetical protein